MRKLKKLRTLLLCLQNLSYNISPETKLNFCKAHWAAYKTVFC